MENSYFNLTNVKPTCDETHLKKLFDIYYLRMVHFSFQIIGNKPQAEDIVQDAFITFWDQSNKLSDEETTIKNFLYSTIKNASLNVLRHNKVTAQHELSQDKWPFEEAIVHTIIRSEVLAEIYQAIALLPDSCQQIFRMGFLDGMKNNQIADTLCISINTVKTQKQRALKVLRTRLNPEMLIILALLAQL